ncbi:MAG: hypothetical protein MPJ50_15050 [Pirellulales bacterium]|nr:hypothetical protein [Pirellulales bacterium]
MFALVFGAYQMGSPCLAIAQDDSQISNEMQRLAEHVLASWKAEREKLREGEFRVRGHLKDNDPQSPIDDLLNCYCAFEFDTDSFRFDYDAPANTNGNPMRVGQKFAYHGDVVTRSVLGSGVCMLIKPEKRDDRAEGIGRYAFNPRLVGALSYNTLVSPRARDWPGQVRVHQEGIAECSDEGNGIYRISYRHADETIRRDIYFDTKQGYAPIRYRSFAGPPSEEVVHAAVRWEECESGECRWILVNDVWIPSSLTQSTYYTGRSGQQRNLTFEWLNVNEGIENEVFTWQGFNLPNQTSIVDVRREGNPIRLAVVGESQLKAPKIEPQKNQWPLTLIALALVAAILIAARWIYRRQPLPM